MNNDLLLLAAGGLVALIAAGLVAILSPGGFVSLVAAAALAALGFLQFAFARAVFDLGTTGASGWFALSLSLTLPVSALWVLLSVMLGRTKGAEARSLALVSASSSGALRGSHVLCAVRSRGSSGAGRLACVPPARPAVGHRCADPA